jgi:hypothetical protein
MPADSHLLGKEAGALADAERGGIFVEPVLAQTDADLGKADVARLRHHFIDGKPAVRFIVPQILPP